MHDSSRLSGKYSPFLILTAGLLLSGCQLIGPIGGERQLAFSDLDVVIWHADEVGGVDVPEHVVQAIRFVTLGNLEAGGTDGCNQFGFEFEELDRYTIRTTSLSATEQACPFESAFLPFSGEVISVDLGTGRMMLSTDDVILRLRSEHLLSVAGSPVLGVWHAPDDAYGDIRDWTDIDRPRLEFTDSARFEIRWECRSDVHCNARMGYFGLGENGKIDFYRSGGQGIGASAEIPGFDDIRYYSVADDTLQLMTADREVAQRFVR